MLLSYTAAVRGWSMLSHPCGPCVLAQPVQTDETVGHSVCWWKCSDNLVSKSKWFSSEHQQIDFLQNWIIWPKQCRFSDGQKTSSQLRWHSWTNIALLYQSRGLVCNTVVRIILTQWTSVFFFRNSSSLETLLKILNITTTSFVTLWQSHNMKHFCSDY